MRIVHHLENSRSFRVVWLLEELGLDYTIAPHLRDPKTHLAPPALLARHPLGHAPLLEDDGQILAETGAIMEHLLDAVPNRLRPSGPGPDLDRWRFWMHHAEGSAMPPLVMALIFSAVPRRAPLILRPIARKIEKAAKRAYFGREIRRLTAYWADRLTETGWFAGDFSAADIIMSYPVFAARTRHPDIASQPQLADWTARIEARPAHQRATSRIAQAVKESQ